MDPVGRRSCRHCKEAKRKCDRATPSCLLCRRKKLECVYPPRRPSYFVPLEPECISSVSAFSEEELLGFEEFCNDLALAHSLPLDNPTLITTGSFDMIGSRHRGAWFLDSESFNVNRTMVETAPDFELSDLNHFVKLFQRWMEDWVKTRCNPFIHRKLYRNSLPSCLQIAFAIYSAYLNKTPDTAETILAIVNDQANLLVSFVDMESDLSSSLLEDVARIHALLSYQIIGLFDGDIRSRYLAEKRMAAMTMLVDSTLEKARNFGREYMLSNEAAQFALTIPLPAQSDESLWQAWILLESVRRTWLITNGIILGYEALKKGRVSCRGDVCFTTREGLWSATSSLEWAKLCAEKDVNFIGRFNGERLLSIPEKDVDEMGKVMVEMTYGKQRYSQWLNDTRCRTALSELA